VVVAPSDADFNLLAATAASQIALLCDLESHLSSEKGFAVATSNLDHFVKVRRDPVFRDAYSRHTHVVADGNPVVWLQRLAGRQVELVTGSDLVEPLMDLAARLRVPVALLGSTPEALRAAADHLMAKSESLTIVARLSPPFGFDPQGPDADRFLRLLEDSGARLCLLALGAPKQEIFAARALGCLPNCGFVSVGAGLDFLAKTQRRAPAWVRGLAMEWFWRLMGDWPRLSKRYRDCALILPSLAVTALKERFRQRAGGVTTAV
jgi:exopolysaccharide biosynthesis WecB/TagA/CpsF family protein